LKVERQAQLQETELENKRKRDFQKGSMDVTHVPFSAPHLLILEHMIITSGQVSSVSECGWNSDPLGQLLLPFYFWNCN
jgi:hypothetical protein